MRVIDVRKTRWLPLCMLLVLQLIFPFCFPSVTFGSNSVPILEYHSIVQKKGNLYCVDPAKFEGQIKTILNAGYKPITATELLEMWEKKDKVVSKPILLTFDDGYKDNYTTAFPILKKYRVKATVFLVTSFIGRPNFLSWEEIKEMQNSGLIDFQSHTVHHPNLQKLKAEEVKNEFVVSKQILEERLHKPIDVFAFPYGSRRAYMYPMLKMAGYKMAFVSDHGVASQKQGMYSLRRIETTDDHFFQALVARQATPTS